MLSTNDLDRTITVATSVQTTTNGETTDSWTESSWYAKELRASGSETFEQSQGVYLARRAYLVRKEDRTFDPAVTRFREGSEDWFYMTSFHAYKGSRDLMVIEGEQRDN